MFWKTKKKDSDPFQFEMVKIIENEKKRKDTWTEHFDEYIKWSVDSDTSKSPMEIIKFSRELADLREQEISDKFID